MARKTVFNLQAFLGFKDHNPMYSTQPAYSLATMIVTGRKISRGLDTFKLIGRGFESNEVNHSGSMNIENLKYLDGTKFIVTPSEEEKEKETHVIEWSDIFDNRSNKYTILN